MKKIGLFNRDNYDITEQGYEAGWLGLDENNPYIFGSIEWHMWNQGYQDAVADEMEIENSFYEFDHYDV